VVVEQTPSDAVGARSVGALLAYGACRRNYRIVALYDNIWSFHMILRKAPIRALAGNLQEHAQ